jgi:hypothetical protein
VLLSFAIGQFIVLLPNLSKNKAIVSRFLHNKVSAAIYCLIFEEHHNLESMTLIRRRKIGTREQTYNAKQCTFRRMSRWGMSARYQQSRTGKHAK